MRRITFKKLCSVCGADGAGLHYGGIVCSCCRIFFLRQTRLQKSPFCPLKGSYNNCQGCRYRKCLASGMIPSDVGRTQSTYEENAITDIDLTRIKTAFDRIKQNISAGFGLINAIKISKSVFEMSQQMIHFDRLIQNNEATPDIESYADVSCPLADVILNSQLSCSRDLPFISQWEIRSKEQRSVRMVHCRGITFYIDFITSIPELHDLNGSDKLQLVKDNFVNTMLLTYYYDIWKRKIPETVLMLRPINYYLPNREQIMLNHMIGKIIVAKRLILASFEELSLTHEEVMILKIIGVFGVGLSESALFTVQKVRTKYCIHLYTLMKKLFPFKSNEEILKRSASLLEILRLLKSMSDTVINVYKELFAANVDALAGNLTYDLYIREY